MSSETRALSKVRIIMKRLGSKGECVEKFLKCLIEQSKAILAFDEFNYQAASIVAIVMAELGHFREAKEIFNQIEYNQQNVNMLVNVAHLEYLKVDKTIV